MSSYCFFTAASFALTCSCWRVDFGDGLGQGLPSGRPMRRSSRPVRGAPTAEWAWPASSEACCACCSASCCRRRLAISCNCLISCSARAICRAFEIVVQRQQLGPRLVGRQLLLVADDFLLHPAPLRQEDHAAGETHRRLLVARRRRLKLGVDLGQRLLRLVDLLGIFARRAARPFNSSSSSANSFRSFSSSA